MERMVISIAVDLTKKQITAFKQECKGVNRDIDIIRWIYDNSTWKDGGYEKLISVDVIEGAAVEGITKVEDDEFDIYKPE